MITHEKDDMINTDATSAIAINDFTLRWVCLHETSFLEAEDDRITASLIR
jgi:hypothetical protein